jgi:hypothetical protein
MYVNHLDRKELLSLQPTRRLAMAMDFMLLEVIMI